MEISNNTFFDEVIENYINNCKHTTEQVIEHKKANDFKYHILYDVHSCYGDESKKYCSLTTEVIYRNNKLILLTYYKCHNNCSKYQFLLSILDNAKTKDWHKCSMSVHLDREFKDNRGLEVLLKKKFDEINYLYYDNAGKKYAITSKISFDDLMNFNDNNYYEMVKYIKNLPKIYDIEYLLNCIEKLFFANYVSVPDDIQVIKKTDELIKQINNKSKNI